VLQLTEQQMFAERLQNDSIEATDIYLSSYESLRLKTYGSRERVQVD
jgi:hypothetical protein